MAFCSKCGMRIDDNTTFCTHCGSQQDAVNHNDQGGFGWGLLGFCIPLVGFILWLVWKDEKPNKAHSVCMGAIISMAISLVMNVITFAIGMLG